MTCKHEGHIHEPFDMTPCEVHEKNFKFAICEQLPEEYYTGWDYADDSGFDNRPICYCKVPKVKRDV